MIKKISVILFILMIILTNINYAADITLEQIAEKFNNSSFSTSEGLEASVQGNTIKIIDSKEDAYDYNTEFEIKNNILEYHHEGAVMLAKDIVAYVIIDSIGQVHGYKEGDILATLNSDQIYDYSFEEEGISVKKDSTAQTIDIKVDITKKIPLVDFSNTHIEVSDLEDLKEYIAGDGFAETTKGNIWFNKNGYDGENTLLVAEKGNLTENTYKSILSILEVMFDNDKVIEYFKNNYTNMSSGNKEFNGFSIKVNPVDKTQLEEKLIPSNSGYEFVRITINKGQVINHVNKSGETEKETQKENNQQTANIQKLPQTGEENNLFPNILYIVIGIACVFLISMLYLLREKK